MSKETKSRHKKTGDDALTKKAKLRTISDVISRLQWDPPGDYGDDAITGASFWLGYDDRIRGPLETNLADFKGIQDGGDIPEHRIFYVRVEQRRPAAASQSSWARSVLWDRRGRVDRVFGSGAGATAPIAAETLQTLHRARHNMQEVAVEREERRQTRLREKSTGRRQTRVSEINVDVS